MTEPGTANRNLLGNLARLGAGLIMVAAGIASVLETRQRATRADRRGGTRSLDELLRDRPSQRRRKPPEAGIAAPATPPRGPLPMQGGAAVRLDFEA